MTPLMHIALPVSSTRLVTRNDTLASQVHLLEEQMSRQAEKVDQLQQQVSSILPVIQGIHRALVA